MKWHQALGFTLLTTVLGLQSAAAGESPAAPAPSPAVLARWQFAGSAAVHADTNGQVFHAAWPHPLTQSLRRETFDKLAAALRRLASPGQSTNHAPDPLVRPVLDDLLSAESYAEWRGVAGQPLDWAWAFALKPDRTPACHTNLVAWMHAVQAGPVQPVTIENGSGWQAGLGTILGPVTVLQAGDWTVIAGGGLSTARGLLGHIKSTRRPAPSLAKVWIAAELNLPRLAPWLNLAAPDRWPHVQWTLTGHGENLRSQARLGFKEPPLSALPDWRVPTQTIREDPARIPLVGFAAARGLGPWLASTPVWKDLGLTVVPEQGYLWGQSQLPFQTFYALQSPDLTNTLRQVAERLPALLGTNMQSRGTATIEFDPNRTEVAWKGLPIIYPSLRPAPDPHYILGGFFPMAPVTNPPPAALLGQFVNRTNLLFYEWEMVGPRIPQYNILWQVANMAAGHPDFTPGSTARQWMSTIGTNLTESGTEIVLESPRVLSFKHTSPLGLNALGLVALSRWLDNPLFPSFARPPSARPSARVPTLAPPRAPNPSPPCSNSASTSITSPPSAKPATAARNAANPIPSRPPSFANPRAPMASPPTSAKTAVTCSIAICATCARWSRPG